MLQRVKQRRKPGQSAGVKPPHAVPCGESRTPVDDARSGRLAPNPLAETDDSTESPPYRTFVIRCWLEPREAPAWRFSLLEAGSGAPRRGFTRLQDLTAFLHDAMVAMETDEHGETAGFE